MKTAIGIQFNSSILNVEIRFYFFKITLTEYFYIAILSQTVIDFNTILAVTSMIML